MHTTESAAGSWLCPETQQSVGPIKNAHGLGGEGASVSAPGPGDVRRGSLVSTLCPGGPEERVSSCLHWVQGDVRRGLFVSTLGPGDVRRGCLCVYTWSRGREERACPCLLRVQGPWRTAWTVPDAHPFCSARPCIPRMPARSTPHSRAPGRPVSMRGWLPGSPSLTALLGAESTYLSLDVQLVLELPVGPLLSGPGLFPPDEAVGLVALDGDVVRWVVLLCNETPETPVMRDASATPRTGDPFLPSRQKQELPSSPGREQLQRLESFIYKPRAAGCQQEQTDRRGSAGSFRCSERDQDLRPPKRWENTFPLF